MKKNRAVSFILAAAAAATVFLAPAGAVKAEATTIKATSGVNLRSSSSSYSRRIGYLSAGTYAKYLGTYNGYYKVSVDGKIGYTHHAYWRGYRVTATDNVNLRSGPSTGYSRIGYIYDGTNARVLGHHGDWLYIEHNGKKGFVHESHWYASQTLCNDLYDVNSRGYCIDERHSTSHHSDGHDHYHSW